MYKNPNNVNDNSNEKPVLPTVETSDEKKPSSNNSSNKRSRDDEYENTSLGSLENLGGVTHVQTPTTMQTDTVKKPAVPPDRTSPHAMQMWMYQLALGATVEKEAEKALKQGYSSQAKIINQSMDVSGAPLSLEKPRPYFIATEDMKFVPDILPAGSAIYTGSGALEKKHIHGIVHAAPGTYERQPSVSLATMRICIYNVIVLLRSNGFKHAAIPLVGGYHFADEIIWNDQDKVAILSTKDLILTRGLILARLIISTIAYANAQGTKVSRLQKIFLVDNQSDELFNEALNSLKNDENARKECPFIFDPADLAIFESRKIDILDSNNELQLEDFAIVNAYRTTFKGFPSSGGVSGCIAGGVGNSLEIQRCMDEEYRKIVQGNFARVFRSQVPANMKDDGDRLLNANLRSRSNLPFTSKPIHLSLIQPASSDTSISLSSIQSASSESVSFIPGYGDHLLHANLRPWSNLPFTDKPPISLSSGKDDLNSGEATGPNSTVFKDTNVSAVEMVNSMLSSSEFDLSIAEQSESQNQQQKHDIDAESQNQQQEDNSDSQDQESLAQLLRP